MPITPQLEACRRRLLALAIAALPLAIPPASAQEFFAAPRDFVVETACDAYRSFKTRSGPTALEVGRTYQGRGLNKAEGATHAFIRVGDESKWVELSCGRFTDGAGTALDGRGARRDTDGAARREAGQCLPFFDDSDETVKVGFGGAVDITPKPPALDAFDKAVASTCGAPGKVVGRDEFKALFAAHPDVLARLRDFTGGRVFAGRGPRGSADDYLADLTDAWFAIAAFDHIFCGEPAASGGKIGGLHFHGRYLQLQKEGNACRMSNHAQNEVVPGVIYTMGVMMKNASGNFVRDARKGYGLTTSAEDIFKIVTRAFADNPTTSSESTGCLLPVADDGHRFTAVFVRRAAGIRTFYPDATPNARGSTQNPPCAGEVAVTR